jgi:hypothetical protein
VGFQPHRRPCVSSGNGQSDQLIFQPSSKSSNCFRLLHTVMQAFMLPLPNS